MKKILVHICCAPDAVYFLKKLREDFPEADLIGFFYDPNIHPYEEYRLRLIETKRACKELGIPLLEGEYNLEDWLSSTVGLEKEPERGERCSVCFDIRLERSAQKAKELGCEAMTTTLLMSPKKSLKQLKESGEKTAKPYGIKFLTLDYRKGGGVQKMFELSKEFAFYQQDYCGCVHALFNQKQEEAVWDLVCYKGRRPGSKEERIFIKVLHLKARELNLPVFEEEFPFLNWKPLWGGIWVEGEAIPSYIVPYSQSIRGRLRADFQSQRGDTLYFNKQFLRIKLSDPFKDEPLEEISPLSSPTFIVPKEYESLLKENRVEAKLQVEFRPEKSSTLIVGSLKAKEFICLPADTLQDGRGISEEEALSILEDTAEDILRGKKALIVAGAHSLGKAGLRSLREKYGLSSGILELPYNGSHLFAQENSP